MAHTVDPQARTCQSDGCDNTGSWRAQLGRWVCNRCYGPGDAYPSDRQVLEHYMSSDVFTERQVLIQYLRVKTNTEDWHAVADAAMDLRELDAKAK